ncbi:acetolactate decarboxylase [bacterium]|nr:acetolactate decarboxylase [bacterium]
MKKFYIIALLFAFIFTTLNSDAFASVEDNKYRMIDHILGGPLPEDKQDTMFQVSTYNALQQEFYDYFVSKKSIEKRYGNFGYGFLKDANAVLLFENNTSYIVRDFNAIRTQDAEHAPVTFGTFKYFNTDDKISIKNITDLNSLLAILDKKLETLNYFIAINAVGSFDKITIKSATGEQKELQNIKGTLIGFRIPEFYEKTAPVGYTLYFIDTDKVFAGEVVNLSSSVMSFNVDYTNQIQLILPKDKSFKVKDFAEYEPKDNTKTTAAKQTQQKDLQQIMNTKNAGDMNPDQTMQMMQMMMPKMNLN